MMTSMTSPQEILKYQPFKTRDCETSPPLASASRRTRMCHCSLFGLSLACCCLLVVGCWLLAIWVGCWVWQFKAQVNWIKRGAYPLPHHFRTGPGAFLHHQCIQIKEMTVIHALPPIVRANRGSLRQQAKRFIFGPPKPITPRDRDNPQAAALLLQRLPFEIRAQIWDNYFHSPATRLVHIRDYAITSAECVAEDWQDHSYRSHLKCHQLEQKRDRMSLLLTCKLM